MKNKIKVTNEYGFFNIELGKKRLGSVDIQDIQNYLGDSGILKCLKHKLINEGLYNMGIISEINKYLEKEKNAKH